MYRKIHTTSTACKVAASFLRINPNSWIPAYIQYSEDDHDAFNSENYENF
jgi:hypothetical protein